VTHEISHSCNDDAFKLDIIGNCATNTEPIRVPNTQHIPTQPIPDSNALNTVF